MVDQHGVVVIRGTGGIEQGGQQMCRRDRDYATRQARRHIPMTMADWASKLDAFLQFNDAEILQNKGKVTAAIAKALSLIHI